MTFLLAALLIGQAAPQGQTPPPGATAPKVQAPPSPPVAQVPDISPAPPTLPAPDQVVLTVNGHSFTTKELEPYLWDRFASKIGDEFVTYELLKEEAAKQNIVITDAEVAKKVHEGLQQFVASSPQNAKDPVKQLRDRDFPPSRIVMATREQMLLEKLVDKSFKPDDYMRIALIMVRPKTQSADDLQKALTASNAAYADLKAGTAWEKVVAKYADARDAANGGEIGWFPIANLPPDLRTQVASLANNAYTKPFNSPQGIQIIRVEAHGKDATAQELAGMKAKSGQELASNLIKKLRDEAKITPAY